MAKVNATLGMYVIADLSRMLGVRFKYPDRLTAKEAAAVMDAARLSPDFRQKIADAERTASGQAGVKLYREVLQHFAIDHPADAAGEPAAFPRPPFAGSKNPANPFEGIHAEDAASLIAWAETQPGYQSAFRDKHHPQHAAYVEETRLLYEAAHPSPASEAPARQAAAQQPQDRDGALAAIERLRQEPAYGDGRHPDHAAAVARMTQLYQAAYPEPAPLDVPPAAAAVPAAQPPPPGGAPAASGRSNPADRIRDIQAGTAYWDKADPGHRQAVDDMARAYQEAYPPPPPEAAAAATGASS